MFRQGVAKGLRFSMPLEEVFSDKHLKWIASEWDSHSAVLARWAMHRLVNRTDVWGQYSVRNTRFGARISPVTLPTADLRNKQRDMVTLDKLERHFKGKKPGHLIGLHCVSPRATCRWFAIDLDVHDDLGSVEHVDRNFNAACAWFGKLREGSLDPCLMSSDGKGGLHLICLLDGFYPLPDVFSFVSQLTADFANYGLRKKPEIFPSAEKLEHLGKWLRLPGRHHTHAHFTQVWIDESDFDEEQWLEGKDAIDYLLSLRPMPLPSSTKALAEVGFGLELIEKRRPVVYVDLDSTIAEYDVWRGLEHIGRPLDGAREFLQELLEFSDVVIYTSRCNPDRAETNDVELLKHLIVEWLGANGMPYTDVYTGRGKPLGHAFIDDRAINCAPQTADDKAKLYQQTVAQVRRLCKVK